MAMLHANVTRCDICKKTWLETVYAVELIVYCDPIRASTALRRHTYRNNVISKYVFAVQTCSGL